MSSWIVPKEHITALVDLATVPGDELTWYYRDNFRSRENWRTEYDEAGHEISRWDAIGQMLTDENYRGVNARYRDEYGDPERYQHVFTISDPRTMPTPIEGIKVAQCYRYQSCDSGDVWDKSESAAFIEALIQHLIPKLPGYEKAPWGWTEENAHAQRLVSMMDMLRNS